MNKLTTLFAITTLAATAGIAQARDLGPDEALKLRDAGTIQSFDKLNAAALAKHPKKHHALCAAMVAEGKTGDEINDAVRAEDDKEKDCELSTLRARCEELEKENADLKTKLQADDYNQGEKDAAEQRDAMKQVIQAGKGSDKGVSFTAGNGDGKGAAADPADLIDAMERLAAEGDKSTGFTLRAKARAKWPNIPDVSPDRIAAARKRFAAG